MDARRQIARLGGLLLRLVPILFVVIWAVTTNSDEGEQCCRPPDPETVNARDVAALIALVEQSRDEKTMAMPEGINPPAETYYMRHPGTLPAMLERDRIAFSVAALAPPRKMRTLLDDIIAGATDGDVRYRARLERLFLAARLSDWDTVREASEALVATATPREAASDPLFLHALALIAIGENRAALDRLDAAIKLDPHHWLARRIAVQTVLRHGEQIIRSRSDCATAVAILLETVSTVPTLVGGEARLIRQFADAVGRDRRTADALSLFAEGMSLFFAGELGAARAALERAARADARLHLPRGCAGRVSAAARQKLEKLE